MQITALVFISAAGSIAQRPCMIDHCFARESNSGVKKEIKKHFRRVVKGRNVVQLVRGKEYDDMNYYVNSTAWMVSWIWENELKFLDRRMRKEGKKMSPNK